jgi:hypothetical protein
VGLILVAALASALAVAAGRQRRSITRLADSRAAVHLADRSMVALQTSRTLPEASADEQVAVVPLPDDAPPGQQWVRVTATVRGRSFELVGIVPRRGAP